jgi:tetratricopeptide (TPR) repeat protein
MGAAVRIYEEALAAGQVAFGPKHPRIARALYDLAEIMRRAGRPREALEAARRAVAVYKEALGEGHPDYRIATVLVERIEKALRR